MHRPSMLLVLTLVASVVTACSQGASSSTTPATNSPLAATLTPSATPSAPPEPTPGPTAGPSPSAEPTPQPPTAWLQLEPGPAPDAREDHTWTVDPAARVAYLFGGRNGERVRGDLWAFDLATDAWRQVRPPGDVPPPRFGHEAVWVDGLGVVIWAGQVGPTSFHDDLWTYDPSANRWTQLPNGGARPIARYGSCAAIGPDGRLWISHGFTEDGTRFADTRAYDFDAGTWSDETPDGRLPVNRCLHGCWWTDDGRFALYAGQTTGVQALGDLWALGAPGEAAAAWERQDASLPDDRNLYAFARHSDAVIVFGGRGLGNAFHRDVYVVDATTLAFEALEPDGERPAGRAAATLIDDPAGGRVLLFGGTTASGALGDTWQLALP